MKRALALVLLSSAASATPSGHKWFNVNSGYPRYRVYAHTSINGQTNFQTTVLPALRAAFTRWTRNNTQITCTHWDIFYDGTFTSPSGPTTALVGNDRINNVLWLGGSQWRYGNNTLGLTTTIFDSQSGEIIDADMEMNNNITWTSNGTGYDYESVVLHEAGHFLGLDHTPSTLAAVMYPSIGPGQIKRQLAPVDVSDVCNVYPGTSTPGSQGYQCQPASPNCQSGLVCRAAAGGSTYYICTVDCTSGQACPAGYTCQNANTGRACLPPVGSPDLCRFCTSGSDCLSGICVTDGQHNWCTVPCQNQANCGSGYDCANFGTASYCVPQTACTNQCTATSNTCAVGYACVSGRCEATGNTGDRCEVSGFCKPCNVCIGTQAAAYCRACCGGQGGGGTCNSCTATACPSGQQCLQVSNSNDRICAPANASSVCQACGASQPCDSGLQCINGRCHAACNPANPGACMACNGTNGTCACAGEEAYSGQACQVSNGFPTCVTGLLCVSGPNGKVCRAPCVIGQAGSCPAGESCQSVDGQTVCVPANTAGARCGPCNDGTCGAGLSCYQGRCYEACNPANPICDTCVQVTATGGVCACDDQRSGPNGFCGHLPPNDLYACQPGLKCIQAKCRVACDPANPMCPIGTTCQAVDGAHYCLDINNGTGGGTGAGGGGGTSQAGGGTGSIGAGGGGGGGGGIINSQGCGCSAGAGSALFGVLAAIAALSARRRSHRR